VAGEIRETLGVPATTDIHEPSQAEPVAAAMDILQIPAFLSRQTDLLLAAGEAAAKHGRAVNVKKGQFMAPAEMAGPIKKLGEAGCDNLMLTERGTFFGYHKLVNDFTGLGDLLELGPPVCFDVTHSTQQPGSGSQTGGRPERAPLLGRAAAAAGVQALFIETHPDPANAKSDGATVLPIDVASSIISDAAAIRSALG
jgi:2-dehydro-3-deoxyphosphooctonate aldolase (KDO 8-P synthase)